MVQYKTNIISLLFKYACQIKTEDLITLEFRGFPSDSKKTVK